MQVMLPVYLPRIRHWILFEFDLIQFDVTIYDSAQHIGTIEDRLEALNRFGDGLKEYLDAIQYWENAGCDTALDHPLTFRYNPYPDMPQQTGPLGDCGVWVCKYMEKLAHKLDLKETGSTKALAWDYRMRMAELFFRARF